MAKIVVEGTRTQTARTVLLAAIAAVAVVLLGFFAIGKLKNRSSAFDLPEKLATGISQTANGFTYSQSQRGHTLFTIHAAKIVQFKGNRAELQGVVITLYGPPGSARQDRISGAEFLYDKGSSVITAAGKVAIDLASPADSSGPGERIHVETEGLRFDGKSGRAATQGPLAFSLPRVSGKAVGGSYDSKSGVLVLQSSVEFHAQEDGEESATFAGHAEFVRDARAAYLLHARSRFGGAQSSADQVILHFRPDGTLLHVDGEDNVHIVSDEGAQLYASNASVDLDARSEPVTAHAGGGVNFLSASPELQMHGNAVEGALVFAPGPDGKPAIHHAQFRNAVSFVIQQNSLGGDPRGLATREMTASTLDVDFAPGPEGRSLATVASARGGAKVDLHDLPFAAPGRHATIYGQQLLAKLNDGHQLRQLTGSGGTKVVNYAPDGATDTTQGDTLEVAFSPEPRSHAAEARETFAPQSAVIATAVQTGRVRLAAEPARGTKTSTGAPQQPLYADGERVEYRVAEDTLRLNGSADRPANVHDETFALTAGQLDVNRSSGEAVAESEVKATFAPKPDGNRSTPPPGLGGAGAVHVTGAAARLSRSTGQAVFLGSGETAARLWQGANSVSAPVLEFTKGGSSVRAHGAENAREAVRAVFAGQSGVTRIAADSLFYSDSTRSGEFQGGVTAQQPGGTVRADALQLFLAEAPAGRPSRIERMVASGHVNFAGPGRRGSGEKLVYTAADGNFLLTGSPGAPPRVIDAEKGSTTGAALLLHSDDKGVEVLGRDPEGGSRRTVTDTRAPR